VELAYVLHTRPWRETSTLAELLSVSEGRIGVVARGARRGRRGAVSPLRPFVRLRCSWGGRGELRTLTAAEPEQAIALAGDALFAGLYLNELLMRLLQRQDAHPELFLLYARALTRLGAGASELEPALREFERGLLDELGYGFPLEIDTTGAPILADRRYRFVVDGGLAPVATGGVERADVAEGDPTGESAGDALFPGSRLLAFAEGDFREDATRRAAKRLMRLALAPHLGDRPLHSRALFRGR
jgi:DNA repair protein RecO (recombination protein O)